MNDAEKQLRLARRALRAAATHLRQAAARGCMDGETRASLVREAGWLENAMEALTRLEARAATHLAAVRKTRRGVAA